MKSAARERDAARGLSEGITLRYIDKLEAALRSMRELAAVAHNGDPWYAENEGMDASAIFKQAREALGEDVSRV